jgi:hypothetical protein
MNLQAALDDYGLARRRKHRGEEARQTAAALSALREYLLDYSAYEDTCEIRPADLFAFLLEYYPSEEEPDAEVALALLEAAAGFALWLVERDERALAPFAAAEERLREDLPRVLRAFTLMRDHARRDDLSSSLDLDTEEGESFGTLATNANRLARLDQIDYASSEEEHFTVTAVDEASVTLTSRERQALGEGAVGPVLVPAEAAKLLRVGDTIHVEIAPGAAGWELLEVLGVRPGGYS